MNERDRDIRVDDENFEFGEGRPGDGAGRREKAGGNGGVYPVSGPEAPDDADVRTQAEIGQGDRGAEGYRDHGESELGEFRPEGGPGDGKRGKP